ncbi:MAG: uroporphyrinogen decarboxylase [Alphaproteobacteria bacterium]|nr:uroporphyrinogen decarboxylase [Alphaproteobacteria bacterium]
MSPFLDTFKGIKSDCPPIWFMRQAGRYLPEYLRVRRGCKGFLDLCYDPERATEVTLQPLERFSLDAAIIFSDILVIPHALGQNVSFKEGIGPKLTPISLHTFEEHLSFKNFLKNAAPVYEAIYLTKSKLAPSKALIGFAGAPWTLALYMIEGEGSRDFSKAKEQAFKNEKGFTTLLDYLSEVISLHLIEQIKAGAQALQLFDTWAGLCPATHFERWITSPTRKIVSTLKVSFPELPLIGFPKGIGANLISYASQTKVSGLSLDMGVSLSWAAQSLPSSLVLQGNLDPTLLVAGEESLKKAILSIHEDMQGRPYIFNLGHGILPQTPPSHVEECIQIVKGLR